jgi:hypothetical protein
VDTNPLRPVIFPELAAVSFIPVPSEETPEMMQRLPHHSLNSLQQVSLILQRKLAKLSLATRLWRRGLPSLLDGVRNAQAMNQRVVKPGYQRLLLGH